MKKDKKRNAGILAMSGEYILKLTSGMEYGADSLEETAYFSNFKLGGK